MDVSRLCRFFHPLVPSQHQHSHPHTPTASSGAPRRPRHRAHALSPPHAEPNADREDDAPANDALHRVAGYRQLPRDVGRRTAGVTPCTAPAHGQPNAGTGMASGGRLPEGRAPLVTPTSRTSSKHRSCVYSLVLPPTLDENDTRYYLLLFNARSTLSLYPRGGGSEAVVPEDNILIIVVN